MLNTKGRIHNMQLVKSRVLTPEDVYDIDCTSVSAAAKRFEKKAKNDKRMSEMLGKIRKKIEGKHK